MKNRDMLLNIVFIGVMLVLGLIPNLGFFRIGSLSITILQIPVIVAGLVMGLKSSALLGTVFGICSWFAALQHANAFMDPVFANPFVSVLPRFLFGIMVGVIWLLLRVNVNEKGFVWRALLTALTSSVLHSLFVLIALYVTIMYSHDAQLLTYISKGFIAFIAYPAGQILIEATASVVVAVPLSRALLKLKQKDIV